MIKNPSDVLKQVSGEALRIGVKKGLEVSPCPADPEDSGHERDENDEAVRGEHRDR